MFEYTNKFVSNANLEKLWNHYTDVSNWHQWDPSLEQATLQGSFENGVKGVIKSFGMPELPFELLNVVDKKGFSNKSEMGPFTVLFTHHINANGDEVSIEHGVVVTGPDKEKVNQIGQGIASSIPESMMKLLDLSK